MHEKETWKEGARRAYYYQQDLYESAATDTRERVVHPSEMPWEESPHGKLKHCVNQRMANVNNAQMDIYIQELAPGKASGKHRHMAEEAVYVLEGKGYDLHWDVEAELKDKYYWHAAAEPKRYDWEEGDLVVIPVNTVHQHHNADPEKPARIISAMNGIYRWLGFLDLEQVEPAAS